MSNTKQHNDNNKNIFDLTGNYWIKANAGSGKTTILVERFLFLLKNHISPKDILCITYTNAGADEMKTRIKQKLQNENIKQDFFAKGFNEQQLEFIIKNLQISTIHSFCQDFLVKQHKINKSAVILNNDARKMEKIINYVIDDVSKNRSIENIISKIAQNLSITEFQNLIENIIKNQNKFRDLNEEIFVNYINNNKNSLSTNDIDKKLKNLITTAILTLLDYNIEENENNLTAKITKYNQNELNEIVITMLKRTPEFAKQMMEENLYDLSNWKDIVFRKDTNEPRKMPKNISFELINLLQEIQSYYINKHNKISADNSYYILKLAVEVLSSYEKIKQDENIITYDDMLYDTKLLANKGELTKIKYIMLDEAQDTNPLCFEIIEKFCDKNNNPSIIFVVGDEKQSIYSFQGANLDYYNKYYNIFKNRTIQTNISNWHDDVKLNTSYRSVEEILNIADFLCQNQHNAFGNEEVKHISTSTQHISQLDNLIDVQFEKIEKDNSINSWLGLLQQEVKKQKNEEKYAEKLAKQILEISKIGGSTAIIVPKRNTKNGLAYEIVGKIQQEIDIELSPDFAIQHIYFQDLVSFFKFHTLQNDDMSLACLLKSDFFHFTDDMLQEICNNKNNLWQNLQNYEWKPEVQMALLFLRDLLSKQSVSEIIELIDKKIEEKKLIQYKKYINLLHSIFTSFIEEGGIDFDIRNFLQYIKNGNNKYEVNIEEKQNTKTSNVCFNTIHGVKGLEYDNVILLDLDERNVIKTDQMMFLQNQNNQKTFFYKTKSIIENDALNTLQQMIDHEENKITLEKWRLLYVAITRAKKRFYYFGNFEKSQFGSFFKNYLTQKQ